MDQPMQSTGLAPAPQGAGISPQRATPEEQTLLEKVVAKAYNLIYDDQAVGSYLEMLKGSGNPDKGLANAVAHTVARVAQAAENGGQKLPGNVLFQAGKEITEDLAELSTKARIKDYEQDQDALDGAFFQAVDDFRLMMQQNGRINPKVHQEDLARLQKMDGSGQFEQVLRGLAASDDQGGQAGEAGAPFPDLLPAGVMLSR
ncbi:hypothetical protein [Roseibium sp.]|uniref:hypothetical protein n=1 Tax=Roseibium sp. TaxID=1936156 RepID=UPI003B516650